MTMAKVGIIMGSSSDLPIMKRAADMLTELEIPFEMKVISAHRTPDRLHRYATGLEERGVRVLIAGAGGAAHLAGVAAALTLVPVLGVPIPTKTMGGLDSLLSIVQMPAGIPVGSLAIGGSGAANAALLAAQILAAHDPALRQRLVDHRRRRAEQTPEDVDYASLED